MKTFWRYLWSMIACVIFVSAVSAACPAVGTVLAIGLIAHLVNSAHSKLFASTIIAISTIVGTIVTAMLVGVKSDSNILANVLNGWPFWLVYGVCIVNAIVIGIITDKKAATQTGHH